MQILSDIFICSENIQATCAKEVFVNYGQNSYEKVII